MRKRKKRERQNAPPCAIGAVRKKLATRKRRKVLAFRSGERKE